MKPAVQGACLQSLCHILGPNAMTDLHNLSGVKFFAVFFQLLETTSGGQMCGGTKFKVLFFYIFGYI
jgi:hypothetical protein